MPGRKDRKEKKKVSLTSASTRYSVASRDDEISCGTEASVNRQKRVRLLLLYDSVIGHMLAAAFTLASHPAGQRTYTGTAGLQTRFSLCSQPLWPSGKALRLVSERTQVRFRFGCSLSSKVVVCGHCLVTSSLTSNETLR